MKPKQGSITVQDSIDKTSKTSPVEHHHIDHEVASPSSSRTKGSTKERGEWTHNPVVLSLLTCGTMSNCDEVRDVYRACLENNDKESMICEAAAKYYKMCHLNNADLNFPPYQEPYHET
jgi:hypothetical protein